MRKYLALASVVGLASLQAMANQVEKKDSWVLSEYQSNGITVCEASTEDRGVIRHYTLKVQKAKNSNMPVEVFLHEKGKAERVSGKKAKRRKT